MESRIPTVLESKFLSQGLMMLTIPIMNTSPLILSFLGITSDRIKYWSREWKIELLLSRTMLSERERD